jgi:hypothetical protein
VPQYFPSVRLLDLCGAPRAATVRNHRDISLTRPVWESLSMIAAKGSLTPRVRLSVDFLESRFGNVRVNLRRREALVAEQLLDYPKVRAPL